MSEIVELIQDVSRKRAWREDRPKTHIRNKRYHRSDQSKVDTATVEYF